jgi:signal recognition particle subunit SRP54
MTPAEREDPSILSGSRKKRIAEGSGTNIQEVNRLIKQFTETRKMMKFVSQGRNMGRMMGNMRKR